MTTDVSERGLETLIVTSLTSETKYVAGKPADYDREYAVDLVQLTTFLRATQPKIAEAFGLDDDSPTRRKFLSRLQGEITKRGTVDVLRKGIDHNNHHLVLFYATPSPDNLKAVELFKQNRFSVTRQLKYARGEELALDVAIFINGLPLFTFELKNNLTKQTYDDAIEQYRRDRDARELLFQFGRCLAHFAVDDQQVHFCTELKGKASWFLPFNKGNKDGAGNPPNPTGLMTGYLWKEILPPSGLIDIIENYAQIVEEKNEKTGKKKRVQIFPRYHQLDVVHHLLNRVAKDGIGKRYLIQHSAGSGKSNSIAWLAYQLIGLKNNDEPLFDSIFVVTDRRILDQQIRNTIKQFAQVRSTVAAVTEGSQQLREFIESGKKIIISTVQKFPFILEEITDAHRKGRFAIIIDEAHSSQGGRTSGAVNRALSTIEAEDDETIEDEINRLIESRRLLKNASYFAFTATPKNKTLEMFGEAYDVAGVTKHRPIHSYTMKQAIEEGFILDVLKYYTPVDSYYKLVKTVEGDPEFDVKKARKKLRRYVESHDHAIRLKAEIMVDHFHEQVLGLNKIGGEARAMVVATGIERAIQYYHAIKAYLRERGSRYEAIVAFSGDHDWEGKPVNESSLNGFSSQFIAERIQEDPYRFLICADKFQTGYDEPLLHTMYVDKVLSGIKAVQTLSRLNRAHPKKHDVFVLDFMNDVDTIRAAFADYYKTTILAEETDPNKVHDLKANLDAAEVYTSEQVNDLVAKYLKGEDRPQLDIILDACVDVYKHKLNEDEQVKFKGDAKAFNRTYSFLSSILPYTNADWEKLSIFLNFLVPKLPAPKEEDLSKGILETIDMDSYRVEKQAVVKIQLPDADAEIEPVPTFGGGHKPEPEIDRLSNIIRSFNDHFGNVPWTDSDRVHRLITEEIPAKVAADRAYQNAMKRPDKQNAKIEHDKALSRVMTAVLNDDAQLFKQFSDNEGFRRWLTDTIFALTYNKPDSAGAQKSGA